MRDSLDRCFLLKHEVTEGVDPTPDAVNDAIAAGMFMPGYSFRELQQIAIQGGLSEAKKKIGQELIDFDVPIAIKGGGAATTVAEWAKGVEICGFTKAAVAAKTVGSPEKVYANSNLPTTLTVTTGGTYTPNVPKRFVVKVTTGGASGTAECSVTCLDDAGVNENTTGNVITTATPIDLGTSGGTITFTFASGNLTLNDAWVVYCYVPGTSYKSRKPADAIVTATCYLYMGGLLWKANAVKGDLVATIKAGELAELRLRLKGKFADVLDAAVPASPSYQDNVEPVYVELAGAVVNADSSLVIESLTIEQNQNLAVRPSINASKGIKGYRHGRRSAVFGMNLEAELEATHPFWANLRAGTEFPINASVGTVSGNIVDFYIRRACYDKNAVNDSDNLMMYQLGGQCRPGPLGDHNIEIFTR